MNTATTPAMDVPPHRAASARRLLALVATGAACANAAAADNPPLGPVDSATVAAMKTWDSGDPTAQEQYILEVINRARRDPQAEGRRLGIDITEGLPRDQVALVGPRPPLAMGAELLKAARAHSQDMYRRSYFYHIDPDGRNAFDFIQKAGRFYPLNGECIFGGTYTVMDTIDQQILDTSVSYRENRNGLLGINPRNRFREIGVGPFAANQPNNMRMTTLMTDDFGTAPDDKPFVLGVVYHDDKQTGMYDIGEGYAGVTVYPDSGAYKAVTGAAGGFAFPIDPGVHTITFDFGVHGTVIKTVIVHNDNVKVDALTSEARKHRKAPKH